MVGAIHEAHRGGLDTGQTVGHHINDKTEHRLLSIILFQISMIDTITEISC